MKAVSITALALQLAALVGVSLWLSRPLWLALLFRGAGMLLCAYILDSGMNAAYKTLYALLLSAFPLLGILAYFILRAGGRARKPTPKKAGGAKAGGYAAAKLGGRCGAADGAEYIATGERFFSMLIKDIRAAKKYVLLQFFIVREGELLEELFAALAVLDGLCKDVVLLPEMNGLDLALDEIEVRGDFFKHATTPPKNTPRPEFGTRSSRYHPSWRKAPARGAQKRACAVTGGPGAAYWQERSACRSGAIPSAPFRRARTSPGSLGKGERGGSPLQGVSTNIITGCRHL